LLDALEEQTRPVQRVVAVDTGSRDRSGSVLTAKLGQAAVFGMDRSTGYAAAVRRALQHKAANAPVAAGTGGFGTGGVGTSGATGRSRDDQVEWLWLLHDDCEPAADALEQLLRGAAETPTAAVLGPKLMDWADRDVIVEAGLTVDTVGRRITGIEPREVDQGQHDGDRDSLAVSSAGVLIRRDVWAQSGGFDPGMTLFGEDIDFCWRVHAAGFRVRVITDAVVFHAMAAARGRRPVSVGRRARLLERRNGLLTLLGNLPAGPMLAATLGNLVLSLLRTVFYLVAKRPTAALDESAAVLGVVGHPIKLAKARGLRARGRRAAYSAVRGDMPPGHSVRRAAEFAASVLSRSSPQDLAGAHHATDDPTDDDSLLTDSGLLQRLLTRPAVLLLLGLIAITIAAERSLITSGTIGGGALLPAWEGSSSLWAQFLQAYHPAGIGSASAGPPYVGLLALLATVLFGKSWLAVDVLLLGCVPLAGITSFLALRRVTGSVPVRVWAAASYALLPVAFGAISAGRLGSAVAFVLIPVVGMLAGRMLSQPPKIARRAAWATGLAVTVGAAFVPLLWPMAVVGALVAGVALWRSVPALFRNLAIVVATPPVLLLPWFIGVLAHPSQLLVEAGLPQPGLVTPDLPAKSLLLLSPGGPGLPPYWVSGALVVAGLAALLAARRLRLIVAGWIVALLGFATALLASRVSVTPAGGEPLTPWPGVALAVAAAGLLLAAAAAADTLRRAPSTDGRARAPRRAAARIPVAILALVSCTAPVLAAAYWLMNGVSGPIGPASGQIVPSLVSATSGAGRQLRTLVLATSGGSGHVSYLLLRGDSPPFSYPDITQVPSAAAALSRAVSALVAAGGGEAVDQSQELARFDIGFVLMRAPVDNGLASVLDNVSGLTQVSVTPGFDLWRLSTLPSRVSVVQPSGVVVPVNSDAVNVSGTPAPASGGTVLLAEPAGSWSAAVNGHPLTPVSSPAGSWAQAFRLPAGGGTLTISRNALVHNLMMALELLAFVVVAALALPGIRSTAELEADAAGAAEAAQVAADADADADGEADRSRRLHRDARPGDGRREADAGAGKSRAGRRRTGTGRPTRARGKSAADRRAAAAARSGAADVKQAGMAGADVAGGAAAASVGAAGAGAAVAGAAGRGRRAAATATELGPARTGAAWPAGQPVSRFIGGPPDSRTRSGQPSATEGGEVSGPFDSPPGRRSGGWDRYGDETAVSGPPVSGQLPRHAVVPGLRRPTWVQRQLWLRGRAQLRTRAAVSGPGWLLKRSGLRWPAGLCRPIRLRRPRRL
jgi:GT2 family glycosyltransferase